MVTEVKGSRDETQVLSDYFLYLEREQRWVESVYGRRRDITATPRAATPDRLHHQPGNATAWKEMGFDPTEMKLGLSEIQT